MPSTLSSLAAPTPESCSSCGELMAPPHRITSAAFTVWRPRPRRAYSTPTARLPSNTIFVVNAHVSTVRFGRPITGCR